MPRQKNPNPLTPAQPGLSKSPKTICSDASFISPVAAVVRPKLTPLDYEEREQLRTLLHSPVFRKAWNNVLLSRPSVMPPMPMGADSAMLSVLANNRLNQLYGWEQFAAAILSQIEDPAPKAPRVADDYSG